MHPTTESTTESNSSSLWRSELLWLASSLVLGLVAAPIFQAMPPRAKLIGLHACALAGIVATGTAWLAARHQIRSQGLIVGVSVLTAFGANLLLAYWGYVELRQMTAQRVPLIPLPSGVGSPAEVTQSLQLQQDLKTVLIPSFRDYLRRRFSAPLLRRFQPLPLWLAEVGSATLVAAMMSRRVFRQMTPAANSDSLMPDTDRIRPPSVDGP